MKKKLLSVALCVALVFAMAVPAFAAQPTISRNGQGYPPLADGSVPLGSMMNNVGFTNVYTSTTNYGSSKI